MPNRQVNSVTHQKRLRRPEGSPDTATSASWPPGGFTSTESGNLACHDGEKFDQGGPGTGGVGEGKLRSGLYRQLLDVGGVITAFVVEMARTRMGRVIVDKPE